MSQENMEIVRSLYADFGRGDFSLMDRESEWREIFEPDFAWHTRDDLPDAGVRKGYEGIVGLRDEWAGAFDDMHIELEELIGAGDHVIAVTRLCGRMRGSGHKLDVEETQVWRMRDGRAAEVRAYLARPEALEAVGLEE